ncbi:hypothetical protein FPOG_02513 [Fusobacterium periodonticum D10]|uniref:Transposase Synechocystis PCC 6803 domain-containing protein n=1 Tax=Fusobacterium periodonticum D10 TaxID=620833 RepID=K1GL22_9FUSO|nr:hypothetical protein FPOG_02513 [Fusobacterium periodonticum D10]
MINKYDVEFKKKIVRLFREEGRTKKSISNEFSVSVATLLLFLTGLDNSVMNAKLMKNPIMNITIWKKILDFVKSLKKLKKKMNS